MNWLALTFLKEPFVHFMALGALLFGLYSFIDTHPPEDNHVTIDVQKMHQLINDFQNHQQHAPNAEELKALVDDYVLEEIYNRKALALSLDKHDPVIRKRLRQKMETLEADLATIEEPTKIELENYFAKNNEKYREPTTYSFEQVYFSLARPKAELDVLLSEARHAIGIGQPINSDDIAISANLSKLTSATIVRQFGQQFLQQLEKLPLGQWSHEPIESTLGLHFVKLNALDVGQIPQLEVIRDRVVRDWQYEKTQIARQQLREQLLNEYQIDIAWPKNEELAQ